MRSTVSGIRDSRLKPVGESGPGAFVTSPNDTPPDRESPEGDPPKGEQQTDRHPAEADETDAHPGHCDTAEREAADRDHTDRHVADRDDPAGQPHPLTARVSGVEHVNQRD